MRRRLKAQAIAATVVALVLALASFPAVDMVNLAATEPFAWWAVVAVVTCAVGDSIIRTALWIVRRVAGWLA